MQQLFVSQQSIKPPDLAFPLVSACVRVVCVCVCVCNAGNIPCYENKNPLRSSR